MPLLTPTYQPPEYRFTFGLDNASHNGPLLFQCTLREEPPGSTDWTENEKDALAQEILDALAGLGFVAQASTATKQRLELTEITETP